MKRQQMTKYVLGGAVGFTFFCASSNAQAKEKSSKTGHLYAGFTPSHPTLIMLQTMKAERARQNMSVIHGEGENPN